MTLNIIVCVNDKFGISFMGRRVSRDRYVIEDILRTVKDGKLLIHPDSLSLFSDFKDEVTADENYLDMAQSGEYCFVEKSDYEKFSSNIESVIIYKWNRSYSADLFFDTDILGDKTPVKTYKFEGHSHKNIIKEVYVL